MVRIAGVNIPDKKRIDFSLPYIYGVGRSLAKRVLNEAKVDANKLTSALTAEEANRIRSILEGNYQVEGDLNRLVSSNKKRERGILNIRSTNNNTMMMRADDKGNAIFWVSCGSLGFKGARKGAPY